MGRLTQRQQQVWFEREYTPEEARLYQRVFGLSPRTPIYEAATSPRVTVTVAKKDAALSLAATSPTMFRELIDTMEVYMVVRGDTGVFSGVLTDAVTGAAISGATVILRKDTTEIGRGVTDASGYFEIAYDFPTVAETSAYAYTAYWAGDDVYNEATSPFISIMVEARIPAISFDINPKTVLPGDSLTWGGDMTDPKKTTYVLADKPMYLQESPDGVTWGDVAGPIYTDASGVYSGTYAAPSVPGTYYYRSRYPGGSPEAAFSPIIAVEVLDPAYEEAVSPVAEVAVTTEIPPPPPAVPWGAVALFAGVVGLIYAITRIR